MAAKRTLVLFLALALVPALATGTAALDHDCLQRGQTISQVEELILEAAKKYKIDADLLWANAKTESNLNPCIISSAGAIGVMQLMPSTALELGVNDPFDAEQNIDGGARFLAKLIQKFQTPQLYLAAYNAGAGAVMRKRYVPNYKETRKHIRKVLRAYQLRRGITDSFEAVQALSFYHQNK